MSSLIRALAILVMVAPALSWDWPTHQYAAREICNYTGCGDCLQAMLNGSIAPDRDFKDTVNHHCYEITQNCPEGNWTCPNRTDCPALAKAQEWLQKAAVDAGCNKSYDVGVASHYFLDSKVFWHTVAGEDYENCHAEFEHDVGLQIESDFNLSVCGVGITKAEFGGYVKGFENGAQASRDLNQDILGYIQAIINGIKESIIRFFAKLLGF